MNFNKDIPLTSFLWALFSAILVVILFFSLNQYFDHDELESIHTSWKILSGQRIYVDFFEHHHPFFYYMLVPLIGVLKEHVVVAIAARVLVFSMLLSIFAITYNISKNLFGKESAAISLILLSTTNIFIFNAIEIRPDVPETLFGLLSISLLFSYFQKKSLKYLILSAISLGASFLFLQKSIFLVFIIGGFLLLSACFKQIKSRYLFLYLTVFIATLMPYYAYLILNDQLHAYLTYNWAVNISLFKLPTPLPKSEAAWSILISSFKMNFFLWIFWLLSPLFLYTPNRGRIGAISLILLIIFLLVQFPYQQYLMLVMPLIAVTAGYSIHKVASLFLKSKLLVLWAIVFISIFCPLNSYLKVIRNSPNVKQLKRMDYVMSITQPADFVYDGEIKFNLFRKDLDFYWFARELAMIYPVNGRHHYYSVYELIDKFKPKVISRYEIRNMGDKRIAAYYRRSDAYPDLFIRVNGQMNAFKAQ